MACVATTLCLIFLCLLRHAVCHDNRDNSTDNEYCETDNFHPVCSGNQVVSIESGLYGRMGTGRCMTVAKEQECFVNVLQILDRNCSGRSECKIIVPNSEMDKTKPCMSLLRVYLEATYKCIPVVSREYLCTRATSRITATSIAAYISLQNLLTPSSPCLPTSVRASSGFWRHWTIQALSGQVLNISLVDYNWKPSSEHPSSSESIVTTDKSSPVIYGYITDKENGRNVTIAGGLQRYRHILLSNGSSVQLKLNISDRFSFLIRYEALGCVDLAPPKDAYLRRDGDKLVVGCHDTRQTWHLNCRNHQWVGVIGNCTHHLVAVRNEGRLSQRSDSLTHNVAIVLIVGISLMICGIIVIAGILCLKRLNKKPCCQGPVRYDNVHTEDLVYKDTDPSYLSPKHEGKEKENKSPRKPKNDYTHIWEHPLPDPVSAAEIFTSQQHQLQSPGSLKVKLPPKASSRSCGASTAGSDDTYHVSMVSRSSKGESTKYFILDKEIGPSCLESPSHSK